MLNEDFIQNQLNLNQILQFKLYSLNRVVSNNIIDNKQKISIDINNYNNECA